eukprot:1332950-Pleurochrysis_carterae.AAC.1
MPARTLPSVASSSPRQAPRAHVSLAAAALALGLRGRSSLLKTLTHAMLQVPSCLTLSASAVVPHPWPSLCPRPFCPPLLPALRTCLVLSTLIRCFVLAIFQPLPVLALVGCLVLVLNCAQSVLPCITPSLASFGSTRYQSAFAFASDVIVLVFASLWPHHKTVILKQAPRGQDDLVGFDEILKRLACRSVLISGAARLPE